jgi:hypothetical protein
MLHRKTIVFLLLTVLVIICTLIFVEYRKSSNPIINILNEQPTSDGELYEKLENMCKNNGNTKYDECSRAPLCGKDNLSWQEKKAALENFSEGAPNYQSCYKDACEGLAVPLCCYAIAATGDPGKCPGYAERLWCPREHCEKISSEKGRACNNGNPGNCSCGSAFNNYCAKEGETLAPPISLCERLKNEGVTGIVCTSNVQPTPTPQDTLPVTQDPKPRCESINFLDSNGGTMVADQRVNSQQKINIKAVGLDDGLRPSLLQICWTLADQNIDFYKTGANWACDTFNTPQQGDTTNSSLASITDKTFEYFATKLTNATQSQISDYGIVFAFNIYSGNKPNIFCSTNPGFNNGLGVILDLSTQNVTDRFTNSTCGIGTVANQSQESCNLKLKYDPNVQIGDTDFDLNGDGSLNISDFTEFVGYYKNKDLKIDYDASTDIGIEDFIKFRDEYVKAQLAK